MAEMEPDEMMKTMKLEYRTWHLTDAHLNKDGMELQN